MPGNAAKQLLCLFSARLKFSLPVSFCLGFAFAFGTGKIFN